MSRSKRTTRRNNLLSLSNQTEEIVRRNPSNLCISVSAVDPAVVILSAKILIGMEMGEETTEIGSTAIIVIIVTIAIGIMAVRLILKQREDVTLIDRTTCPNRQLTLKPNYAQPTKWYRNTLIQGKCHK
jgi:hypothetical protein